MLLAAVWRRAASPRWLLLPWAGAGRNLSPWLPAATTTSASPNDHPPLAGVKSRCATSGVFFFLHLVNVAVMYGSRHALIRYATFNDTHKKNRCCAWIPEVWLRGLKGRHKCLYLWQEKTCSATWMVMSHCSPLWYRPSKSAPSPEAGSRTASGERLRWMRRKNRREWVMKSGFKCARHITKVKHR